MTKISPEAYELAVQARNYIKPLYLGGRDAAFSFDDGKYATFIQEFLDARISPTPHIPDRIATPNDGDGDAAS